jgi:chemotaxis protein MotB
MKCFSTPIWMSLALALSPLAVAQEAPAEQAATPAVTVEVAVTKADEIAAMQTAIAEARKEAANVAGERDVALKETVAIREAKQQLEAELADLRGQLEQSNHEVWQWKDKASVLEKKLGAGEEAFAKLASFRDEVSVAMKEMAVLKEGLADVRGELKAPAERVALKKELAELKTARDSAVAGLEELRNTSKQQSEVLAKVQQERDTLDKNLVAANEALQTARNEAAGLKDAKSIADKNLDATRDELSATREALASLQKESSQLRSTMQPLAAEIQAVKDQAAKATTAIQQASVAREEAEQARIKVETQLKEVNGQLAAALDTQSGLKQMVATKTQEIDGLRKKIEEMEAKTASKSTEEKRESAGL